ncbi:MAG TPA: phosphodiester glycosidase family protein [Verrucomicrobiae bacterium]|nr:phosphodiester glycosidase family protein [Verrucomicrobiae bacterium]
MEVPVDATGLGYTNVRAAEIPWSIHIVKVARSNSLYEVHSVHAGGTALGLDTLSDQLNLVKPVLGAPVAAVNGDFYQRDRSYAGAARGLQVVDGELLSGPGNKINMWIDVDGEAHASPMISKFEVTWPDGTVTPFRLNGERSPNGVELYTSAIGRSTRTSGGGRELILEREEGSPWLPLHVGKSYTARIREVRDSGNTTVTANTLVLSLGPGAARRLASPAVGASLSISTATLPSLHGVRTALGGGPLLVHNGHRQRIEEGGSESYEFSSMFERHPRAAIGWNQDWWFLVEVDGRQRWLSVGMTLDELARFMVSLGCQEAMNCDGGGSATLWYEGEVRNSPCDRSEREIANCLVIVKKKSPNQAASRGQ